jgi:carbamoyl-phosphate synthase large subunit
MHMPKRTDIRKILIIGSGPIVIGQACEFDYAGTQACLALREEGYEIVLVNSNPATIMTDPQMADRVYIEPITKEFVTHIIEKEKPCAILPTVGGQTALNLALELAKDGILSAHNIELLGATPQTIELAEDRSLFKQTIQKIRLDVPKSCSVKNMEEARLALGKLGLPVIVRPSFILGGSGSGIAHTEKEFFALCEHAFQASANQEILLDEALIGWKEFEMEVVRDKNDNCIIVCCIENIDPLGIHTGDSITVAPSQTLTDKEYQKMRDASFAILRAIGVETGGSNVQFAIHPETGKMVVIEMNPRVSRSSALASKATGFPIAKVAAKLAVGYTLPELSSELTGHQIPASFEPSIDYVVVKLPRFNFEKFKGCQEILGTQMQSVGEAMAIGRTFQEALLKGMRSMELSSIPKYSDLHKALEIPGPFRLWAIFDAFRDGMSLSEIHQLTHIDPWFLHQIGNLVAKEKMIGNQENLLALKQSGFSDLQIAAFSNQTEAEIRLKRKEWGIAPVYKRVDSCAAEFATSVAYLYSSYEEECESHPTDRPKMIILGSGPSRIGQGIEFDYGCVHAIQALKMEGYETIMINCNPETISTDYNCADKLYCSPMTAEDVLGIIDKELPDAVLVQYGGQTPLNLTQSLASAGVPLLGVTTGLIETTEDRACFKQFLELLKLKQPANAMIHSMEEGLKAAKHMGYPLIVRPSFVLGGRAMSIVLQESELEQSLLEAFSASVDKPVLLEKFLMDAIEVDIDAISDGKEVYIPGILEHVEPAGVHSGDSACSLPPFSLSDAIQSELRAQTKKIALVLGLTGLLNIQFAIQGNEIYVLEVNPRASRTVPFTSKATGIDLIKIATRCLLGISLKTQGFLEGPDLKYFAVKEAVLPFSKFGIDPMLGPEMKSTGEVMGLGNTFVEAYAKAQIASGYPLTKPGKGIVPGWGNTPAAKSLRKALQIQQHYGVNSLNELHSVQEVLCPNIY